VTPLKWFLLGLMVSWTPSLIFLACIAFGRLGKGRKCASKLLTDLQRDEQRSNRVKARTYVPSSLQKAG
jgi:hypothetical protein